MTSIDKVLTHQRIDNNYNKPYYGGFDSSINDKWDHIGYAISLNNNRYCSLSKNRSNNGLQPIRGSYESGLPPCDILDENIEIHSDNRPASNLFYLYEFKHGEGYYYKVVYAFGGTPTMFNLKGFNKAYNGEIRAGTDNSISASVMSWAIYKSPPKFKLMLKPRVKKETMAPTIFNWKKVGVGYRPKQLPDNQFTEYATLTNPIIDNKVRYIVYEKYLGENRYKYRVSVVGNDMRNTWGLKGTEKIKDGEWRETEWRSRSEIPRMIKVFYDRTGKFLNRPLTVKYTLDNGIEKYGNSHIENFAKTNKEITKGDFNNTNNMRIPLIGKGYPLSNWRTIGKAGLHNASGRPSKFDHTLQERILDNGVFDYRVVKTNVNQPIVIPLKPGERAVDWEVRYTNCTPALGFVTGYYVLRVVE